MRYIARLYSLKGKWSTITPVEARIKSNKSTTD